MRIENELCLIVEQENSLFKIVNVQKQKMKINPGKLDYNIDLLFTFPHIGVIN